MPSQRSNPSFASSSPGELSSMAQSLQQLSKHHEEVNNKLENYAKLVTDYLRLPPLARLQPVSPKFKDVWQWPQLETLAREKLGVTAAKLDDIATSEYKQGMQTLQGELASLHERFVSQVEACKADISLPLRVRKEFFELHGNLEKLIEEILEYSGVTVGAGYNARHDNHAWHERLIKGLQEESAGLAKQYLGDPHGEMLFAWRDLRHALKDIKEDDEKLLQYSMGRLQTLDGEVLVLTRSLAAFMAAIKHKETMKTTEADSGSQVSAARKTAKIAPEPMARSSNGVPMSAQSSTGVGAAAPVSTITLQNPQKEAENTDNTNAAAHAKQAQPSNTPARTHSTTGAIPTLTASDQVTRVDARPSTVGCDHATSRAISDASERGDAESQSSWVGTKMFVSTNGQITRFTATLNNMSGATRFYVHTTLHDIKIDTRACHMHDEKGICHQRRLTCFLTGGGCYYFLFRSNCKSEIDHKSQVPEPTVVLMKQGLEQMKKLLPISIFSNSTFKVTYSSRSPALSPSTHSQCPKDTEQASTRKMIEPLEATNTDLFEDGSVRECISDLLSKAWAPKSFANSRVESEGLTLKIEGKSNRVLGRARVQALQERLSSPMTRLDVLTLLMSFASEDNRSEWSGQKPSGSMEEARKIDFHAKALLEKESSGAYAHQWK